MSLNFRTLTLARRGIANYLFKKAFCVSFEVTYSCNARCKHCHLGGPIKDEERANSERFGELSRQIRPVVAQISGGEPLIRKDLEQIIEAIRIPNRPPFIILTTNGALLSRDRYYRLRQAGVDEFSLSLDYPDERHDEFRNIPGLFNRIRKLIEDISTENNKAITLACVIQRDNFRELVKLAEMARAWGVKINFSTYTWLRTNNKGFLLNDQELEEFVEVQKQLLDFKRKYDTIRTSDYVFFKMIEFFKNERLPDCRAGERFLIVNPSGSLSPCGLIIEKYNSQQEIKQNFMKNNTCEYCYTSIRANSERPAWYLLKDNFQSIFK
jgi:MoaA/NifB/PqqE/SkfB family radical SAM enzyme